MTGTKTKIKISSNEIITVKNNNIFRGWCGLNADKVRERKLNTKNNWEIAKTTKDNVIAWAVSSKANIPTLKALSVSKAIKNP
jgi:hypothetical protein